MAAHLGNTILRTIAASVCGAMLFCCLSAGARAQEPAQQPQHALEYLLYRQATDAGDGAAAEQHAYAAWRAAETELGKTGVTGKLAYIYGREIVMTDPNLALAPLQRAKAIIDAGLGGAPQGGLNLYLTYAQFALSDAKKRDTEPLRNALLAAEQSQDRRVPDEIAMWLNVANAELDRENYEEAASAAGKAESDILVFAPDDNVDMAKVFLARGIATLMPKRRTLEDAITARENFENGRLLFPPQKNFETFDPAFAKLAGWSAAANAVILTKGGKDAAPSKSRAHDAPLFAPAPGQPLDCLIKWKDKTAPKYPPGAIQKGYIGAVIVVFDLGDDDAVHNPRILAEVPSDTFSDAVLKAMQSWRLAAPPLKMPGCRTNVTAQFTFVIDD